MLLIVCFILDLRYSIVSGVNCFLNAENNIFYPQFEKCTVSTSLKKNISRESSDIKIVRESTPNISKSTVG
jgi:hypothetical protein